MAGTGPQVVELKLQGGPCDGLIRHVFAHQLDVGWPIGWRPLDADERWGYYETEEPWDGETLRVAATYHPATAEPI